MSFTINHAIDIALQTFASLYAGASVKVLVLVLALLLCFAGCRLMRWSSALYGVIAGVAVGTCVTSLIPFGQSQVNSLILSILAMVIGGIVLGALAFRFRYLGIFLICGFLGVMVAYIPATFVQEVSSMGFWCVLLGCGVLFGITGVLFLKPACLLATGLSGIPAGLTLTGLMGVSMGVGILLGCVLTIAGCLVQLYLLRRMEDAAELALQHTDPNLPVVMEESGEEQDDIDKISSRVAEHIGITGSYQTVDFAVSDEPETVDDRTMMMPDIAEQPEESSKPAEEPVADETQKETGAMEQTAQFAWTAEEAVNQAAAAPAEASAVDEQTQPPEVSGETAQFAWTKEEPVHETAEEPSADGQLQEHGEAVSAEQAVAEPALKPKKSRGWFFFGRKKKIQAEQQEEQLQDLTDQMEEPAEQLEEQLQDLIDQTEEPAEPMEDAEEAAQQLEASSDQPEAQSAEEPMAEEQADGFQTQETKPEEILQELETEPVEPEHLFQMTEEVLSEQPKQEKKQSRWVMPVVLVLAALAFALMGIQYVELLLALCFAGYVLRHYRSVAFVCAVLCIRRVADLFLLILHQESWMLVAPHAVSCICFLVLTIAALRADSRAR
ncbi:MAG: DUF4203 domain-containing protein [Clostridiales bacterium]|nr:DUF4203 domain-containing protein [Clostridiales bacterium]